MALIVACLMWWSYLGWLEDALEHGARRASRAQIGPLTRDAFSLSHFPLVCGIVGFAVAIEEIVLHPNESAPAPVVLSLGLGVALFVGFSAVSYWRVTGRILITRVFVVAAMVVPMVLVAQLAPVWPLVVAASAVAALVLLEGEEPTETRMSADSAAG